VVIPKTTALQISKAVD